MDLRQATTPLLGEATNPIDAAIAAAIAATPARLGNRRAELQRAADAVPWLCRNGDGEPS
jgi:SLT domain-containing protein